MHRIFLRKEIAKLRCREKIVFYSRVAPSVAVPGDINPSDATQNVKLLLVPLLDENADEYTQLLDFVPDVSAGKPRKSVASVPIIGANSCTLLS